MGFQYQSGIGQLLFIRGNQGPGLIRGEIHLEISTIHTKETMETKIADQLQIPGAEANQADHARRGGFAGFHARAGDEAKESGVHARTAGEIEDETAAAGFEQFVEKLRNRGAIQVAGTTDNGEHHGIATGMNEKNGRSNVTSHGNGKVEVKGRSVKKAKY